MINHSGWEVTSVYAWPEGNAEIHIDREGKEVTHRRSDGSEIRVSCDAWTQIDSLLWQTNCRAADGSSWKYRNQIELDEAGRMVRFHYALWPGLSEIDMILFSESGESNALLPAVTQG